MLSEAIQFYSLSYIARQARLNKSTVHRFLYGTKSLALETTNRILGTLIALEEHRKKERLPKRSQEAITRKEEVK